MQNETKTLKKARYFQLKRIEKGMCPTCPNAIPEGWTKPCIPCLIKKREQAQRRNGHKPWTKGCRGRPPKYSLPVPAEEKV